MAGYRSLRTRRLQCLGWNHARRPHHVENAGGKAEQQKHDHPPRRDSEPAIEQPSRWPHPQGHRRPARSTAEIRGRSPTDRRWTRSLPLVGGEVRTDVTQPFAETMESSGERSLISRRLFTIVRFARVVGHAFDTRGDSARSRRSAASKPAGPYALPPELVKNRCGRGKALCAMKEYPVADRAGGAEFGLRAVRPGRQPGGPVSCDPLRDGMSRDGPAGAAAPRRIARLCTASSI